VAHEETQEGQVVKGTTGGQSSARINSYSLSPAQMENIKQVKRKANAAECDVYRMLGEAKLYFRPFNGFCDFIGRVSGRWVLIEVKVAENGGERLTFSPFNARMTLLMARDLNAEVYIVIKRKDGYYALEGRKMLSWMGKSKAKRSTMKLGKWKKALKPLTEIIEELKALKEER